MNHYFGPELTHKIIRQFDECLVPGAWLLVGPSEPNVTYFSSFRTVNAPGVTLYQKPDRSTPREEEEAFTTAPPGLPPPLPDEDISVTDVLVSESSSATLADVRRYADQGAWESAARCCEQMLKINNLNSTVHFYNALILGQTEEAKRSPKVSAEGYIPGSAGPFWRTTTWDSLSRPEAIRGQRSGR